MNSILSFYWYIVQIIGVTMTRLLFIILEFNIIQTFDNKICVINKGGITDLTENLTSNTTTEAAKSKETASIQLTPIFRHPRL